MPAKFTKKEALRGITIDELVAWRDRAAKDTVYIEKIREEYTDKYPGQWIAVYEEEVIGPVRTPEELSILLHKKKIEPIRTTFSCLDPRYEQALSL